jgi:hypothetical protein
VWYNVTMENVNGSWRFVRDNDGHDYIIPADSEQEFRDWVETMEADWGVATGYTGRDFNDYRLRSHPSCYIFKGEFSLEKS